MFCNVEDVALEGAFELNSDLEKKIRYKIENVGDYIHQVSYVDLNNEKHAFYAKMACIYGVLVWLEGKNLIPSSENIVSIHEGNLSINYSSSSSVGQVTSYSEQYDYYLNFLLGSPPVGA